MGLKIGVFCLGMLIAMGAQFASAQEESTSLGDNGETHAKIGEVIKQKEYQQSEKITDMELNAQAGSLSRYSAQAILGYSGPAVNDVTSTTQPNPLNKKVPAQTNVSGAVGIRYRISPNDTFYLSSGVEGYFQPNGQKNPDWENPAAEYDHSYRVGNVQMYTGFEAVKTTTSFYMAEGETAGAELKHYMKYNIPSSRFILGGEVAALEWFYDRDYRKADGKGIIDTEFEVIPSLEYRVLRNLNLSTSYSTAWAHYRGINATNTYSGYPGSWWIGVGYGITRDVYIKPYLSFYPQAMTWSQTAIAMSTYISVF